MKILLKSQDELIKENFTLDKYNHVQSSFDKSFIALSCRIESVIIEEAPIENLSNGEHLVFTNFTSEAIKDIITVSEEERKYVFCRKFFFRKSLKKLLK